MSKRMKWNVKDKREEKKEKERERFIINNSPPQPTHNCNEVGANLNLSEAEVLFSLSPPSSLSVSFHV